MTNIFLVIISFILAIFLVFAVRWVKSKRKVWLMEKFVSKALHQELITGQQQLIESYKEKIKSLEAANERLGFVNDKFLEMLEGFAAKIPVEVENDDSKSAARLDAMILETMGKKGIYDYLEKIKCAYFKGDLSDEEYDSQISYLLSHLNKNP